MKTFEDLVYICSFDKLFYELKENIYDYKIGQYKLLEKAYFDNLKSENFVQSTVGKDKENIINTDVRSSKIHKNPNIRIDAKCLTEYKTFLDNKTIKPLKDSLECDFNYDSKINLIKYEVGDHFNEFHYDSLKDNEIATILIFPPKYMIGEFTGGDLIFKIENEEYRVEPSKFEDKFVCVIFGKILHKCEPITSGTRYVIKNTIISTLPDIISDEKIFKLKDIEENIININDEYLKNKIIHNKTQINEHNDKLIKLIIEYTEIQKTYLLDNQPESLDIFDKYTKNK